MVQSKYSFVEWKRGAKIFVLLNGTSEKLKISLGSAPELTPSNPGGDVTL